MTNNDDGFNFDLEEMKRAVESPTIEVPDWALKDVESFDKWLMGEFADEKQR